MTKLKTNRKLPQFFIMMLLFAAVVSCGRQSNEIEEAKNAGISSASYSILISESRRTELAKIRLDGQYAIVSNCLGKRMKESNVLAQLDYLDKIRSNCYSWLMKEVNSLCRVGGQINEANPYFMSKPYDKTEAAVIWKDTLFHDNEGNPFTLMHLMFRSMDRFEFALSKLSKGTGCRVDRDALPIVESPAEMKDIGVIPFKVLRWDAYHFNEITIWESIMRILGFCQDMLMKESIVLDCLKLRCD